jgi:hypothetical protein
MDNAGEVLCLLGFTEQEILSHAGKEVVLFSDEALSHYPLQVYFDGKTCDLASFAEICKQRVFLPFSYKVHPSIPEEEARYWLTKCQEVEWQQQLIAADYQDFGVKVFANILQRENGDSDRDSFYELKKIFPGVPAFICGAGPSLDLQIPLLKKAQNKGLIFAGGASLGKISLQDAPIHIAAGIDPNPIYEKVLPHGQFEAPFFYQSRFSSQILQVLHAPLFQVPSNPGYKLEGWLEEKEPFDGGWTVATFCVALAIHFGCNPIILVGVDLSYQGEPYSKSALRYSDREKGPVWTQRDWVLSARWLEHIAKSHQEISFYNASYSGLKMEGIPFVSLSSYLERAREYDCNALSHVVRAHWKKSHPLKAIALLEKSLSVVEKCVDKALFLCKEYYPQDPSSKAAFVLNAFDLQEEVFYQHVLQPVWEVWKHPIERSLPKQNREYFQMVNEFLFFKRVCAEYRGEICKKNATKT